jgi:hypothetical protein
MKPRLISRNLLVTTGSSHLEEKGRESTHLFYLLVHVTLSNTYLTLFKLSFVATLSLTTLSKHFAKVHQQSQGSQGFQECPTCKFPVFLKANQWFHFIELYLTRILIFQA